MCNGQFAVCTIYSENWFVSNVQSALCNVQSAIWNVNCAICNLQCAAQWIAICSTEQCSMQSSVCVCTVQSTVCSVLPFCVLSTALCRNLTNRRHLGLATVAPPWWPPLVVGLATAGQSESHTGPLIPSTLCLFDSIECWCWTLFNAAMCFSPLVFGTLAAPNTQLPWNVIHGTFVCGPRQAMMMRHSVRIWMKWVCPSNASGVDNTRWPTDKVARNYAVILLSSTWSWTNASSSHFWARWTFPWIVLIHRKMCFIHESKFDKKCCSQWCDVDQKFIAETILTQVKAFIFNPLWFSPNNQTRCHVKRLLSCCLFWILTNSSFVN